jgi:hypothetical protein
MTSIDSESDYKDRLIRYYKKIPVKGDQSVLDDWRSNDKTLDYLHNNLSLLSELRSSLFGETETEKYLRKNKDNYGSIFSEKDQEDFVETNILREDLLGEESTDSDEQRLKINKLLVLYIPYEGDVASILAIAVRQSLLEPYLKDLWAYYNQNKQILQRLGLNKKQHRNTEAIFDLESFLIFCYRKLEYELIII